MNQLLKIFVVLALGSAARAADGPGAARLVVTNYPLAQAVLSNNCIVVAASGQVDVAWAQAHDMLGRRRLLDDVQRAYVASRPAGKKIAFTITALPGVTNKWHYLNKDHEPSDIVEIARFGPDAACAELLFRVDGERFFGNFQMVFAVRAWPDGPDKTRYYADIWAYPENGAVRFFVRQLGLIERFFRKKTGELEQIVRDVVLQLNREQLVTFITPPPAAH
jgi:hypothetical protein